MAGEKRCERIGRARVRRPHRSPAGVVIFCSVFFFLFYHFLNRDSRFIRLVLFRDPVGRSARSRHRRVRRSRPVAQCCRSRVRRIVDHTNDIIVSVFFFFLNRTPQCDNRKPPYFYRTQRRFFLRTVDISSRELGR